MKLSMQITVVLSLIVAGCGGSGSSRPPANTAPTISAIADQSTSANVASAAITFTVTDDDIASLSFSVSSDNQQVVADAGLDLAISGGNGSITVTPVVDNLGDAFITIIVNDRLMHQPVQSRLPTARRSMRRSSTIASRTC